MVFPEQGSESAELLPGDVVITVRDKPHPQFKREGAKDLAYIAPPLRRGDALYALRVRTLGGRDALLCGSPLAASLAAGGAGGVVASTLHGEGMPDPSDPWDNPPGDLIVRMLNPPAPPERRALRSAARQRPLLLLPDAQAVPAAAAAGGVAGAALRTQREADEMAAEELIQSSDSGRRAAPTGVILVVTTCGEEAASAAAEAFAAGATAALRVLRWRRVRVIIPESPADAPAELLLDDEWAALGCADAVVLDCDTADGAAAADDSLEGIERAERRIRRAHAALASHGVIDALWLRHWRGAHVAGVGAGGVALLGAAPPGALGPDGAPPRALLPVMLRAGGGCCGWSALRAALSSADQRNCGGARGGGAADARVCAGVLLGSAVSVEPAIWWQVRCKRGQLLRNCSVRSCFDLTVSRRAAGGHGGAAGGAAARGACRHSCRGWQAWRR